MTDLPGLDAWITSDEAPEANCPACGSPALQGAGCPECGAYVQTSAEYERDVRDLDAEADEWKLD